MDNWLLPPLAAMTAFAAIAAMLRLGRAGALDHPNRRSLHSAPVPRGGGIGILAGILPAVAAGHLDPALLAGTSLLAAVSWWDDRRSLPVLLRLACQLAAGGLALTALPGWGWAALAVALLAIVWMTNLFNFMDGADGLAGGMAMFGFGAYAWAAAAAGQGPLAVMAACVAAAAAGFLPFNFAPARIFMGDVGSVPLGFLAAGLGLQGAQLGAWPLWFPLLAFAPFVADATATLLRRVLRGERVWEAHRQHYYQRLVGMGWSHRRLALREYLLMAAAAVSALAMRDWTTLAQGAGLAAWLLLLLGLMRWIDLRMPRR